MTPKGVSKMIKGDKVYVVENYLVEERTAALLAGEVGLAVIFECYANSARVHITDLNGVFWEIPTIAVCTVPEGHLTNLYDEPCPACGLQLFMPRQIALTVDDVDTMRPLRPTINLRLPSEPKMQSAITLEALKVFMHRRYPEVEDDCDDKHPVTAIGIVLLASVILGTTDKAALIRFTCYSRDFISAISFNMENNRAWFNGRYAVLGWLLPDGTIDDDRFGEDIEMACGNLWLPGIDAATTTDPCGIYWKEQNR